MCVSLSLLSLAVPRSHESCGVTGQNEHQQKVSQVQAAPQREGESSFMVDVCHPVRDGGGCEKTYPDVVVETYQGTSVKLDK